MLLVEDVTLTIAPVGETLHIVRLCQYRLPFIVILLNYLLLGNNLEILIRIRCCRSQVHPVRIDDFCLFLEIKRLSILHYDCFLQFVAEILLIP